VFIETQAVGTPVASFDRRGIGEVVLDKVTGLLAPDYLSAFTNAA
jgi:glycosyltransferase involved in cell wall biosynthesis